MFWLYLTLKKKGNATINPIRIICANFYTQLSAS